MEIEKNVEMPAPIRKGRPPKYPFSKMEVGDSAFFEGEVKVDMSCAPYNAARQWGKNNGRKFSGRAMDGGVRIWRIA